MKNVIAVPLLIKVNEPWSDRWKDRPKKWKEKKLKEGEFEEKQWLKPQKLHLRTWAWKRTVTLWAWITVRAVPLRPYTHHGTDRAVITALSCIEPIFILLVIGRQLSEGLPAIQGFQRRFLKIKSSSFLQKALRMLSLMSNQENAC